MKEALRHVVGAALGAPIGEVRSVAGGDINAAWHIRLDDGRQAFVKSNAHAPPGLFSAEARGLRWLAEADALRVPRVWAVGDAPAFLALEWLEPGPRSANHDAQLGRGLAALHASGAASIGLDHDNYLGTLPQENEPMEDWPTFYARRRLAPLLARATDDGVAPPGWPRRFERLCTRLPELAGPVEPPARLHGDLWSGNLHVAPDGGPALIDPAVYGGHREVDLAMLDLFGGLPPRMVASYHECQPLAPGWRERLPLWQLYPLLAHVCLFGAGYVPAVERTLDDLE